MPRPRQRTPELRRHILDVALTVLADEGVPALTTRRVADQAATSLPALYELFGDKAGLVRELFFEGFRQLQVALEQVVETDDPVTDLRATIDAFRGFALANPRLFEVMFARPFEVFEPSADERALGDATSARLLDRVRAATRGHDAGERGDGAAVDAAHVVLGVCIGLASQEVGGWLGRTGASRDRRWRLAVDAVLNGLRR